MYYYYHLQNCYIITQCFKYQVILNIIVFKWFIIIETVFKYETLLNTLKY